MLYEIVDEGTTSAASGIARDLHDDKLSATRASSRQPGEFTTQASNHGSFNVETINGGLFYKLGGRKFAGRMTVMVLSNRVSSHVLVSPASIRGVYLLRSPYKT